MNVLTHNFLATVLRCWLPDINQTYYARHFQKLLLGQAKLIYSLSSGLFLKCMWAGGHFSFFIISFGPAHVASY